MASTIHSYINRPSSDKSKDSKPEMVTMTQGLLKDTARFQEMAEMANPQQAEEDRAKVFMDRLPHVQAASRRLQGQLGIHGDERWPLPPLPYCRNPFAVEMNARKIRAALENCKKFAVPTDRESSKSEFLDATSIYGEKRMVLQAGQAPKIRLAWFEDEKSGREAENSNVIPRMMNQGLQEELEESGDGGMSGKSVETFHLQCCSPYLRCSIKFRNPVQQH